MQASTGGSYNVAVGYEALQNPSNLQNTVAVGPFAMQNAGNAAKNNVAVGYNAMQNATGTLNVAMGYQAFQNGNGSSNIVLGENTMQNGYGWVILHLDSKLLPMRVVTIILPLAITL